MQYKFPIHVDEWNAIYDANQLQKGEYSGGLTALRFGFHLFLMVLPFNLVFYYHILPAFFTVLSALLLFFIYKKEIGEAQAFYISLFFIILKSTNGTLGHWFFTPLTFSIPFLFLLHYMYKKCLKIQSIKNISLLALVSIILFFTYPIALIFYFSTQFFTFKWRVFFQKQNHIISLISIIVVLFSAGLTAFAFILKQNPVTIILTKALIPIDWFGIALIESPLEILTWFGFIAAIMGLYAVLKQTKRVKAYSSELAWLIVGLVWISISYLTQLSLFVPLERVIFYTALITPFFASYIYKIGQNLFLKVTSFTIKRICIIAIIIIAILLFPFLLTDFELREPGHEIYYAIQDEEYQFIQELNLSSNQTILAPLFTSLAIKVTTDANVVIHPPFIENISLVEQVNSFYLPIPCDSIQDIYAKLHQRTKFTHIYARKELTCLNQKIKLFTNRDKMYFYKDNQVKS